ncbi:TetR/AcrR family transcriptional regulator C-terminal domain-containing protein [Streptomyces lydicus]|uniref:TetR/AcrR family transcriptional regulator C-terminal domain-containing protein n=1 Tax=Streptomyces lydicus TaxID=47763 RepID=UPI0010134DA1|nr:TetR/AcrR family transcriptional regulator C-terminal domain-containing protein [Streptomyces lydicus]MCZ1011497.1 TetR/AcrR family transcriptional regulator C-terminal domain-containing protein [Streptomyces lydicus]
MGISRSAVVDAALEVLDEQGLDLVTMRAVADRLGVQHNTVRWHVDNKRRLLVLMSDAVLAGLDVAALPRLWEDRVRALARWCREAILARRDAARLLAGLATTEANTYRFADTMIQTLLDAGFSPRTAAWANWTIFYLVLGITQEQQAHSAEASARMTEFDDPDYPALSKVASQVVAGTFEERFEFALNMQVIALRTELDRTSDAPS